MIRKSKKMKPATVLEEPTAAIVDNMKIDMGLDIKNQCHLCDDDTWYEDADLQKHISNHITEINSVA